MALFSSPASASVTGGCQGTGTIGSTRYEAAALDPANPIAVPAEADVAYEGSVPLRGLPAPCTGVFSVTLPGGPLDSPVPTATALGGTLLSGAALTSAAFAKGGKP